MNTSSAFSFGRPLVLAAALGLSTLVAHAQTPLLHYELDGNGANTGSLGVNPEGPSAYDLTLGNEAAYLASGTGFGRFDRAFSTGDGTQDYAFADTANDTSLALSAMTISLWVNISAGANSDRLVSNVGTAGDGGFDLYLNNVSGDTFRLSYGYNKAGEVVTSSSSRYVMGDWLFIAVTFDGTNARFYSGTDEVSLGLDNTLSKPGSITASSGRFEIGGTAASSNDRTPSALFNDVRIYGEALNETQLEAIRQSAVIPEPSTYAMIFGVLTLGFVAVRKRRRC